MIAFITSFRAKALAQDWNYHVWLLERTVRSMLAQVRGEVRVVVACHEIPDTQLARDPRLHFESVNFPPPNRTNDDMCVDKVLKLSAGAKWALKKGCDYVVFNDADDLVSNQIGGYVADHHGEDGWYCADEFFYSYGGFFARHFDIPDGAAGPCVIVRADLLTFETPPFLGPWANLMLVGGEQNYLTLLARHNKETNVLAAVGLGHYRAFMADIGHALRALPFTANVVINHRDSTSFVSGGVGSYSFASSTGPTQLRSRLGNVKRSVKRLATLRVVTGRIRHEFMIPSDREIPHRYRKAGSIFWR